MTPKKIYGIINILVLFATGVLFCYTYMDFSFIFLNVSLQSILVMILTVVLVYALKAFRLYFALYGKEISFKQYMKQYCKVVPVSVMIPFKLGELFRMYCYGYQIQNYFSGGAVILLDRFADTLALVTWIVLLNIVSGAELTILFYVLLVLLVVLIFGYLLFPGMYQYWKKYFLRAKGSKGKLCMLKAIELVNSAYNELEIVLKGRGTILYLLSLIAWLAEIGGLVIVNQLLMQQETSVVIFEYLTSALVGQKSIYMSQFIFASVVFMMVIYLIIQLVGKFANRKEE